MLKNLLEKGKRDLWAEAESDYGIPMSQDFRDRLEEDWEVSEVNPENKEEVQAALSDLKCIISECFEKLELLYYFYSRKPKEKTAGKLYQRSFEKRLYLVEFIMERQLPGVFLLKQSSNLRKRINWKQVCAEWNEMHPYDRMDPALLKVKYYRAIAEKDIQRKFYNRKFHESLVRLEQMIPKLWEYYDKEFKEEWEPLMKSQKATLAATLEAAKNLDKKYKEAQNERSHSQEVQE